MTVHYSKFAFVLLIALVAVLPISGAMAASIRDDYESYDLFLSVENVPAVGYSMTSNTDAVISEQGGGDPFSGFQDQYIFLNPTGYGTPGPVSMPEHSGEFITPLLTLNFDETHESYQFTFELQDFTREVIDLERRGFDGEALNIQPQHADFVGVQVDGYLAGSKIFETFFVAVDDPLQSYEVNVYGVASGSGTIFDRLDVFFYSDTIVGFDNLVIDEDIATNACNFTDGRLNNNPAKDCAPAHVDYCDGTTLTVRNIDGLELLQVPVSAFANPPADGSVIVASGNGIIVSQDDSTNVYVTGWEADPFWGDGLKPYVIKINQACTSGQNVSPLNP